MKHSKRKNYHQNLEFSISNCAYMGKDLGGLFEIVMNRSGFSDDGSILGMMYD